MSKQYVLSASEFKSQKAAVNKIADWDKRGELKGNPPFVYEVVKKYRAVRVWKLEEVK